MAGLDVESVNSSRGNHCYDCIQHRPMRTCNQCRQNGSKDTFITW